jgi:hypothetical protein
MFKNITSDIVRMKNVRMKNVTSKGPINWFISTEKYCRDLNQLYCAFTCITALNFFLKQV